jgi:tetratricopeptide (TPR) repeat protein
LQLDDGTVLTQTFFADAESAAQDDTLQDRATYLLLEVLADEPYFIPALVLLAGMLLDSPGTVPFVSDLIQAIELIDPGSPEAEQVREVLSSWYGQADLVPPDEETEDWDEEEQGSSRVPDDIAARLAEFDAAYRPEPTRGQLAHARYQSAISHLARDDPATAEHAAREAVDLDPEVADYRLILAEALDRQGNEAEAFFVLQQAASDLPDEASVYEGLGNFHMAPAHPDYESARLAYLRALRTEPEAPWRVELGLGQACRELGRRDEAIRWLRSAYRDGPLEPPVVLGLVYALADLDRGASQAEFEEAAEIITTAVEQRSDSAELWVCLAQLQARAGQIALAIDSLRQATQLNPHHPFAADFLRELEDWYAG